MIIFFSVLSCYSSFKFATTNINCTKSDEFWLMGYAPLLRKR